MATYSCYLVIIYIFLLSFETSVAENKVKSGKSGKSTEKISSRNGNSAAAASTPTGYTDGRLCKRNCTGTIMNCYFHFNLETFYTMSKACYGCPNPVSDCNREDCIVGGGVKRTVMVVNREMPGPAIEVCKNDKVFVYLENNLADGESTTIHWHGQHMRGDQYMDGVPWVTQCPILYNNNFTYEFTARDPGTYWWHSHVEMQRGDGVYGAFIVRETPQDNDHSNEYDTDLSSHVIMAGDWNDRLRLDVFEAYALAGDWLEPTGILINGLGPQFNNNITNTPMANFIVQRGRRHRFRFINVGFFDCPLEFSIEGHKMRIIATDSRDVAPVEVDSFVSSSGERFDFVLNANQNVGTYYIKVKGYLICERLGSYTLGTLQYMGGSTTPTSPRPTYANAAPTGGVILNPVSRTNATMYSRVITIDELRSLFISEVNGANPFKYWITVDMSGIDHPVFHRYPYYGFNDVAPDLRARTPQFNRISHKYLDRPLMPARNTISGDQFCDADKLRRMGVNCMTTFCECPHVVFIPLGELVELIFVELWDQDEAPALHPIHLHGYSFRVMGWGEVGRNVSFQQFVNLDNNNRLRRNFNYPPLKDTVSVPKGGYTIVRFRADNPGYWLMHCHVDVHASEGMDIVFQVGEDYQMNDAPSGFPTCKNWRY